jgi:hypothetical protein
LENGILLSERKQYRKIITLQGGCSMNPLSIWTYYRRHKRRTALLLALIAMTVASLYLLPALSLETFFGPERTISRYLQRFNAVQSKLDRELDPTVISQIRAHPDVAMVLPKNSVEIRVPNVGGIDFSFNLFGLQEGDAATVMAQCDVVLKQGQPLQPRTNNLLLSEEIVAALDLKIGDTIDRSIDDSYRAIPSPLKLVGILSGDVRLGIVSYEYLDGHEPYRDSIDRGFLVIAQPGREAAVEDLLMNEIRSHRVATFTYRGLEEEIIDDRRCCPIDLCLYDEFRRLCSTTKKFAPYEHHLAQRRGTGTRYRHPNPGAPGRGTHHSELYLSPIWYRRPTY